MKREDVMQGSWSVAVEEKHPSLVVDNAVLVGGHGGGRWRWMWWRTAAMDGVTDGGWCGDGVLARTVYEWENGGRGTGNHVLGHTYLKYGKVTNLAPV